MPNAGGQRVQLADDVHVVGWLHTSAGQRLLAAQYDSPRRPRCLCVEGGVEMQIVRRGSHWHLARMPGTGLLHSKHCPSAEDINLFSGTICYATSAMRDGADGDLVVRFDPAVSRGRPVSALSIDGLLDLLIEDAGLNAGAGRGRRQWDQVRSALGAAASGITVAGHGRLSSLLVLPENFAVETYPAAQERQEQFLSDDVGPRLVCTRVKEIAKSMHGWSLALKHMPDTRFWIPTELGEVLAARDDGATPLPPAGNTLALALVRPGRGKNARPHSFQVKALALRRIDASYMPSQSDDEDAVLAQLAACGAAFMRPLRYDAPWDYPMADFAVGDGERRRCVFVLSPTGRKSVDSTKRMTANALLGSGMAVSVWDKGSWTNPPFPL